MESLNSLVNYFFKILQASSSSPLVRWFLAALAISRAIQPTGWPENYPLTDGERFNFIVVGSGSAGAVIAARLSEIPHWNVLLIEAGGDPPPTSVIPSLFVTLANTEYDWGYRAYLDEGVGENHPGRYLLMTRGKMLGGSSSNNYEIYSRGVPQDYDEWNQVAPGWDWNTCLYYFKKLENMTDHSVFENPYNAHLHSTDGPVKISRPPLNDIIKDMNDRLLWSFEELGIKILLENNGPIIDGISRPHFTFADGRRSSSAEAYLRPIKDRPNLRVAKYVRVTKILVDSVSMNAYGVEVLLNDGKIMYIYSDMEVIVSAGTIDSPKLLMLSGIGPKRDLKRININVIADLPVGKNLHDHSFAPIVFKGSQGLENVVPNIMATNLSSFPAPILNGFVRFDYSKNKPEYQIFSTTIIAAASLAVRYGCTTVANYDDPFCNSWAKANVFNEMVVTSLLLLHPSSRGQISLRSKDPLEDPLIELGYFRNETDLDALTEGVKFLIGLANTTYFRNNKESIAKLDVTACRDLKWGSDSYWKCYVKNTVSSLMHPVGTCKMGVDGVVNERLQVHGIVGLRVADASIMPQIPSGNTNIPTMMIGERAADIIKEDYANLNNELYF